eukprot:gnl/Dysnectes_brevis/73_a91_15940.p1 GENE.gnl/Dysnectes_brevis/73_a91_15940~~gnl/Dysnectes_brevis/73_a91_15940.p1  ORF type:complete len:118 (+),score=15.54 gnl/Dysnectes_brevis/73_a91_15940:72-425(+)
MNKQDKINFLELPSTNLSITKKFFEEVFSWTFIDYGTEYTAFSNSGINGGFYLSEQSATTKNGSVLIVLHSENLEQTLEKVIAHKAVIVKDIFPFPGGRRFHFIEPSGNEFAVSSHK